MIVVWGAWCVECRAEQSEVNGAAEDLAGTAEFVGSTSATASADGAGATSGEKDVPYPSIDGNDGQALQAFTGTLTPYTVPAFVVLDAEGRIAASIIGELPSRLTLVDVVEEVASGSRRATLMGEWFQDQALSGSMPLAIPVALVAGPGLVLLPVRDPAAAGLPLLRHRPVRRRPRRR